MSKSVKSLKLSKNMKIGLYVVLAILILGSVVYMLTKQKETFAPLSGACIKNARDLVCRRGYTLEEAVKHGYDDTNCDWPKGNWEELGRIKPEIKHFNKVSDICAHFGGDEKTWLSYDFFKNKFIVKETEAVMVLDDEYTSNANNLPIKPHEVIVCSSRLENNDNMKFEVQQQFLYGPAENVCC